MASVTRGMTSQGQMAGRRSTGPAEIIGLGEAATMARRAYPHPRQTGNRYQADRDAAGRWRARHKALMTSGRTDCTAASGPKPSRRRLRLKIRRQGEI